VNWEPFDLIAVDTYNAAEVAHLYADSIKKLANSNKPLVISEFGCTTIKGAFDLGVRGMFIVEWDGAHAVRLTDSHERDESEQTKTSTIASTFSIATWLLEPIYKVR
jgi:hypothetical protein